MNSNHLISINSIVDTERPKSPLAADWPTNTNSFKVEWNEINRFKSINVHNCKYLFELLLLLLLLLLLFIFGKVVASSSGWQLGGSHFISHPAASVVQFSNSSGASVDCWIRSSEPVALSWIDVNRNAIAAIPGLRYNSLPQWYANDMLMIC